MDRHQVRFALLKVSCVVLLASTWVFWSFVFATRPEVTGSDTLSSLVRLPASLPAQIPGISAIPGIPQNFKPPIRTPEVTAMDTVKVPCWDKVQEAAHDTAARWVRLTGQACQTANSDQGEEQTVTVRNLTNGYTATVFLTQAKNMTTDFIPLESGKNEILIRFDQGPGVHLESQVFFMRD